MGIYTSNRYLNEGVVHDYASEIPANMAYGASLGCAQVLADCQANDMALFESAIYSDFAGVKALQEGFQALNENACTSVIKKIVEMFKKLIAKIKGIFAAFIAKLTGAFKNGKDLVKKYEKQIVKYSNWKNFKCKGIRIPKSDNIKSAIDGMFQAHSPANMYDLLASDDDVIVGYVGGAKTPKEIEDKDAEDIKNDIVKLYIPKVSEISDLHETVMDELFNDEETLDGDDQVKSASFFSKSWIKTVLSDDKWINDVKKYNEQLEKNINTIIDNLNKTDDKIAKWMTGKDNKESDGRYKTTDIMGGDFSTSSSKTSKGQDKIDKDSSSEIGTGNGGNIEAIQKGVHALQKVASNEQEVIAKVTAEYMTVAKFSMAQARKVWTAAAAWSSGVHKESVEYTQAVAESAAEQFYMNMEAVH